MIAPPNADLTAATVVTERPRKRLLDQPVELDGMSPRVTVSTGVSQYQAC